ncbi:MAG: L,D-transpeptidase family protein [Kiritimatiellia bacterium]
MKVKEFSNYRAPKRRPWIPVLVFLLVVVAFVWFVRRPRRETVSEVIAVPVAATQAGEVVPRMDRPQRRQPPVAVPSVPVALPGDVSALMQQAEQHRQADQLQAARELYQRALGLATDASVRAEIEKPLGEIHIALLFSQRPMPEKEAYVIQRGDQLRLIARRFGTTVDLIQQGNAITNPDRIRLGDRLRVFRGAFEVVANKTRRDMVVYLNGAFFKRYRVGTGEFGKTPVGTFVVRDKIVDPSWWPPDGREVPFGHPDNVLGTRWLSIEATGETPRVRGYGIHGTWEPESIGHEESAGCIRMLNEEVEEFFLYIPSGTPVRIEE